MQGTGETDITAIIAKESVLSVQLALDGLSFAVCRKGEILAAQCRAFIAGQDLAAGLRQAVESTPALSLEYSEVCTVLDTDRVCWIPEKFFDRAYAKEYLKANSIRKTSGDKIVVCKAADGMIGLMCLPREVYRYLKEMYGEIRYSHPLVVNIRRSYEESSLMLNFTDKFLHASIVKGGELRWLEVFPYTSVADVLYYLHKIKEIEELEFQKIVVSGIRSAGWAKHLSAYYKNVRMDASAVSGLQVRKGEDTGRYTNVIEAR